MGEAQVRVLSLDGMRVAVIGAGAAGLCTARELAREGLKPIVFERTSEVGGQWQYTEHTERGPLGGDSSERVHSAIYASLRTNLPTSVMAFPGLPFPGDLPGDTPRFCGHREVQAYLLRFTETHGLRRYIRFDEEVVAITRGDHFAVAHCGLDGEHRLQEVEAVAICNGHYAEPYIPSLPGSFAGTQSHSHAYRRPDPFAGMRIAILGAKSSGTDLSRELAGVARAVHLCARGHDGHRRLAPRLFAEPSIIGVGPGRSIELQDGRRLEVDHLLYCTGYRYAAPFLSAPLAPDEVEVGDDLIHPLFLDLVVATEPRLAFIGLPFGVAPFPLFAAQARWWAQTLSGRCALPRRTEMQQEVARRTGRMKDAGVPRRHWLRYGDRQFAYVDDLRRRVGDAPLPEGHAALYRAAHEARLSDPEGYRDGAWRFGAPRL